MIRTLILALQLASAAVLSAATSAVSFDWALIDNAGNAPDPQTGYGAVNYSFQISKHEVTNAQYTAFLNAVDPTGANALSLYNGTMALDFGGIELQASNPAGSKYVGIPGREQNPVTRVTFSDAMRFMNWLHNGQGSGDTETGAYTIGSGFDEVRLADARYWIPSEDEWYKAAYHDASAGTAGVYFDYATGSDSEPISDQPDDNPSAVNYFNTDFIPNGFNDGFAVSGSDTGEVPENPLTDVGAYTAATSPYGTFDQNGNVREWIEVPDTLFLRFWRGGAWNFGPDALEADSRDGEGIAEEDGWDLGFRVARALLPGDFDGSGAVDNTDLNLLLVNWGAATSPLPAGWIGSPPDGSTIDTFELNQLLGNWGTGVAAVPEPKALLLLVAGISASTRRAAPTSSP